MDTKNEIPAKFLGNLAFTSFAYLWTGFTCCVNLANKTGSLRGIEWGYHVYASWNIECGINGDSHGYMNGLQLTKTVSVGNLTGIEFSTKGM